LTYFNRFYRRNTLKRDRPPKSSKSTKSNTSCYPHSTKACENCVSRGFDFSIEPENKPEVAPEEHPSNESQQGINNLQPKRGKTGPGIEAFRPHLLFRVEKSFSYSFLEDPKYYGVREGISEKQENGKEGDEEDESDEELQDTSTDFERVYKQHRRPIKAVNEGVKGSVNDKLTDITNCVKLVTKQENNEEKVEADGNENKKPVKKEGKENESRLEKKKENIWLEKNFYNEPLQMQE